MENDFEKMTLENSYPSGLTMDEVNPELPKVEERYPDQFFFGILPSWGANIRHAKNIEFKNVKMTTRKNDKREMIVTDDVEGFKNN